MASTMRRVARWAKISTAAAQAPWRPAAESRALNAATSKWLLPGDFELFSGVLGASRHVFGHVSAVFVRFGGPKSTTGAQSPCLLKDLEGFLPLLSPAQAVDGLA